MLMDLYGIHLLGPKNMTCTKIYVPSKELVDSSTISQSTLYSIYLNNDMSSANPSANFNVTVESSSNLYNSIWCIVFDSVNVYTKVKNNFYNAFCPFFLCDSFCLSNCDICQFFRIPVKWLDILISFLQGPVVLILNLPILYCCCWELSVFIGEWRSYCPLKVYCLVSRDIFMPAAFMLWFLLDIWF